MTTTTPALSRNAMILGQLGQVRLIARQFHRHLPSSLTLEDLISAGTIGLIQAVDRYDPSRGWQLNTFAERRIRGAMLDLLRKEDPLSRSERQKNRSAAYPLQSLDQLWQDAPALVPPHAGTSPLEQATESELRERLNQARTHLPMLTQQVLLLLDQGLTSRAVARQLGLHESRIHQIKTEAIRRLRLLLGITPARRAA